jgi:hypothetical protein
MGRIMKILGVILALALIYAIVTGLGLTRLFKARRGAVKTLMITDFEDPQNDFDWTTGGYAKMEPSKDNKTHGKYSAKVTFLLSSQFYPAPTPPPDNTWQPEVILDLDSITQLKAYEWGDYAEFKMDVFNPQAEPLNYHIQVVDSKSYVYEYPGTLTPMKVTNISFPLLNLIQARLDLSNIRSLRFWVDMTGATEPLVVYLDNIRLEGDASTYHPVPTPTPHR